MYPATHGHLQALWMLEFRGAGTQRKETATYELHVFISRVLDARIAARQRDIWECSDVPHIFWTVLVRVDFIENSLLDKYICERREGTKDLLATTHAS